jgi:hypothetical protein
MSVIMIKEPSIVNGSALQVMLIASEVEKSTLPFVGKFISPLRVILKTLTVPQYFPLGTGGLIATHLLSKH